MSISTPVGPGDAAAAAVSVRASAGLTDWLARERTGFAFTTYQSGHLVLVGRTPGGGVSTDWRSYAYATGLWSNGGGLWLATLAQVWRLENALRPRERLNGLHDALYAPRTAHVTGGLDVHELCQDRLGRLILVNTRYSCLATLSRRDSFAPLWKPSFVSALKPQDRCHLNGVALQDGLPRYVTVAAASDEEGGWREQRRDGGLLIDVAEDRIVAEGLSMPHSPRVHDGAVWLLDSGRGELVRIDPASGARTAVCFFPGFLRGLAFHGGFALVTASLGRNGPFDGLELGTALAQRGEAAQCAVFVVDLAKGGIAHTLSIEGRVGELFDVAMLPSVACPRALGPDRDTLEKVVSFDPALRPLHPPASA